MEFKGVEQDNILIDLIYDAFFGVFGLSRGAATTTTTIMSGQILATIRSVVITESTDEMSLEAQGIALHSGRKTE